MLEIVEYIYTNDLEIAKIPAATPRKLDDLCPLPEWTGTNKEEYAKAKKKRDLLSIELDAEVSKRLEMVFALATAKKFLEYDKFWYVYKLDYRGRIYPKSSYLSIMKSKPIKVLLEFGEGEYLTDEGVYWLKIHIANTYGLDKEKYAERIIWVDSNLDLIELIGRDPFSYRSEWEDTDSPLEFIAACQAWVDHIEGKKVHLPIQLDATNSGLQMYSGLLRDREGGQTVNIVPLYDTDGTQLRADVYNNVAEVVNKLLAERDYIKVIDYTDKLGEAHSIYTPPIGDSLVGKITRKLVKRPTMTTPYGVTFRGINEQLYDELKALDDAGKSFWKGDTWVVNRILTDVVEKAIGQVVKGSRIGQDYLVSVSRLYKKPMYWKTPIYDFPVKQNTLDPNQSRVHTLFGHLTIKTPGKKHSTQRQANQVAPNFIHSIDSTVLYNIIERSQGSLGTIHDCLLVSPNYGKEAVQWYKDAFITVMDTDPLRQFQQQVDKDEEVKFPEYGSLTWDDVQEAEYIIC